jgi:hypothetical protein
MHLRWIVVLFALVAPACERQASPAPASTPPAAAAPPAAPPVATAPVAAAPPSPAPVPAAAPAPASEEPLPDALAKLEKTAGIVDVKREGEPAVLNSVRAAKNSGFDRVVFEFRDRVPGYHLEYIDKPVRDCGAGDVKPIAGDAWLEVRFYPAYAHTEAGQPTVAEREISPALPIVREIERTCDFEAVVTWVIGAASPNRYRRFELESPPRLVIDIDH